MSAQRSGRGGEPKFEEAMAQLEELVRRVEAGDTPLEESLAAFERGVALVRSLHARLDAVQSRIEELSRTSEGALHVSTVAPAGEGAAAPGRTGGADDQEEEDEDW